MTSYVLVCGDRYWTDKPTIERTLKRLLLPGDIVLQGGNGYFENGRTARSVKDLAHCVRGADALAFQVARQLGHSSHTIWAEWEVDGKAAGPRRNAEMLSLKPRLVIAFHDDIIKSRGTRDMILKASRSGVGYILVDAGGEEVGL